jgi:ubiquinone/menaquinone biosynthesis C-methylase UbiE/bacterioferritin-associated ferredoxin
MKEQQAMTDDEIREAVREGYAGVARQTSSCCGPTTGCACGTDVARDVSRNIGYSEEEMDAVPDGANLGLGCGNPVALASLREGETVLDLGSGAGFDCFLAANRVGERGRVIGVDMTPEMLQKARENARKGNYDNVEFRLGEIENLPTADNSVDAVISNCVINLSPDKNRVFGEAFRSLRPGGRLMVSDIVLLQPLPEFIRNSVEAYIGCLSGALMKDDYMGAIEAAGFGDIEIVDETHFPIDLMANDPTAAAVIEKQGIGREEMTNLAASVVSVKVSAVKPNGAA